MKGTPLSARVVWRRLADVPTDAVLGALATLPGAFWMSTRRGVFAGALPTGHRSGLDPEPALEPDETGDGALAFPRWVGAVPYEAARGGERTPDADLRPPAWLTAPAWQGYDAVVRFDQGGTAGLLGLSTAAIDRLEQAILARRAPLAPSGASLSLSGPLEPAHVHERRIERALELIARGELYQVNLARRFEFHVRGHPFELLWRLSQPRPDTGGTPSPVGPSGLARYAAAVDLGGVRLISTSPESFLELGAGGAVATRPIKGTRPRHADPELDSKLRLELDASEKERAELAMVIDIERNDLGRLAVPGSVALAEPPAVVSHATVHHRQALVTARLRPGVTRTELLRATMPSGSVTGAPKVRAMDLIRELEAHRRGLYTGALGTLFSDGKLELSMAIRCLLARGHAAEYFSGGGIVIDSDPKAEVQETLWKARPLSALLGPEGFG